MTPLDRCLQLLRMHVPPERLTASFGKSIVEEALKELEDNKLIKLSPEIKNEQTN